MSVPTHNLYDFIHQVLKSRYLIKFFYPWGSRKITDIIDNLTPEHLDEIAQYNTSSFFDLQRNKIFGKASKNISWTAFQPVVLCHDQEPLNWDLYSDLELNLRQITTGTGKFSLDYYKKCILLHSEENSQEVLRYNESGLFSLAHWWSHAIIARDWYRFAHLDNRINKQQILKRFLVYARATDGSRKYRQQFIDQLDPSNCQIGSFIDNNVNSESSATYNTYDHSHTEVSVILETVIDRIHLTEKVCRAIACKHPFLLLAGCGSLQYLKKYGFKTFEPLIDESYDQEPDIDLRSKLILQQMHAIASFSKEQMAQLQDIAEFNHKHFFSDKFYNTVVSELVDNVSKAHCNELDYKSMYKQLAIVKKENFDRYKLQRASLLPLIWHTKKGGTLENYVPPDLN